MFARMFRLPKFHRQNPALVAQRIEHLTTDQKVGGSSPSKRTTNLVSSHESRVFYFSALPELQEVNHRACRGEDFNFVARACALLGWSAQALGLKAMLFADGAGGT